VKPGAWLSSRPAALSLLYLLGTTAFPSLHLAFHDIDHDHEGGGVRYHARHGSEAGEHVHQHAHGEDGDHGHETDHRPEPPREEGGHGLTSLAHFQSAVGDGSPLAFELQPLGTTPELTPSPAVAPLAGRLDARPPSSRGPPARLLRA
jgi:hypothetical protein